jgi:hypothetical protein
MTQAQAMAEDVEAALNAVLERKPLFATLRRQACCVNLIDFAQILTKPFRKKARRLQHGLLAHTTKASQAAQNQHNSAASFLSHGFGASRQDKTCLVAHGTRHRDAAPAVLHEHRLLQLQRV